VKSSSKAQSATSLPRSPQDEVSSRSVKYLTMMAVRVACFILMVVVQPFGWYTWVFAAAAIFLPYIAVVIANVGQESNEPPVENPERALEAPSADAPSAPPSAPAVIRISEAKPGASDQDEHRA
jgi:hypothetical protein